jgi:hypothetical protein
VLHGLGHERGEAGLDLGRDAFLDQGDDLLLLLGVHVHRVPTGVAPLPCSPFGDTRLSANGATRSVHGRHPIDACGPRTIAAWSSLRKFRTVLTHRGSSRRSDRLPAVTRMATCAFVAVAACAAMLQPNEIAHAAYRRCPRR